MRVELLPAAPLPGGVKVARRPVKPLVLVRVQVWQPIECGMRNSRETSGGASEDSAFRIPHSAFKDGRQIQAGCTRLESGTGQSGVGALPTPSANYPKPQRKEHHANRPTLPKPVAPSSELQTRTRHQISAGADAYERLFTDTRNLETQTL